MLLDTYIKEKKLMVREPIQAEIEMTKNIKFIFLIRWKSFIGKDDLLNRRSY